MTIKKNIGSLDRIIRLALGAVMLYVGFFDNPIVSGGAPQKMVAILAFIPIITAFVRFCPLYTLGGIDTCGDKTSTK